MTENKPLIIPELVALDADAGPGKEDVIEFLATTVAGAGRASSPDGLAADAKKRESTAPEVPVVSTVGAGDSSVAGYILADVNGGDETERLRTAMAYGSAAASLPGTTLPTPADLPEQAAVVTRLS